MENMKTYTKPAVAGNETKPEVISSSLRPALKLSNSKNKAGKLGLSLIFDILKKILMGNFCA